MKRRWLSGGILVVHPMAKLANDERRRRKRKEKQKTKMMGAEMGTGEGRFRKAQRKIGKNTEKGSSQNM